MMKAYRDGGEVARVIQTLAPAGENLYLTGEVILVSSSFGENKRWSTYLLLADSVNMNYHMLSKLKAAL